MTRMEPCPFCGCERVVLWAYEKKDGSDLFSCKAVCQGCGATVEGSKRGNKTVGLAKDAARRKWNTRAGQTGEEMER